MSIRYLDKNADLVGTVAETFNVTSSNKNLQITIDGGGTQDIVLTEGGARTAAQVAADINATLTGGTAYAVASGPQAGHVRIRTTSANGASSTILIGAPSNNCNTLLGFTATTYTGYGPAHTSWTQVAGTKQELIDKIETELLAVGWTTISGSGTTNLLMQSALSPPGENLQMRLRVKDNAGNCVTLSIENVAGTVASTNSTTAGLMLLPAASKQWLFTVNKYQAFIRMPATTTARGFAAFGLPALRERLQGVITEARWGGGNAINDTDGTLRTSFRTRMSYATIGENVGNFACVINGNLIQQNNTTGGPLGAPALTPTCQLVNNAGGVCNYRWHDDRADMLSAQIGWGQTAITDPGKWRGYLWDAFVSTEMYTGDVTFSADSHNWIVLTDSNAGSQGMQRGTLALVTP